MAELLKLDEHESEREESGELIQEKTIEEQPRWIEDVCCLAPQDAKADTSGGPQTKAPTRNQRRRNPQRSANKTHCEQYIG